ncbi:Sulfite exporter TauE/SafE [compost metagenome]
MREHQRKGAVRWPVFAWMTVGILIGAGFGAITAEAISGPHLQKIIGVFALIIAVQLALNFKPNASRNVPGKAGLILAGTVIGWASAIFGIGGGSLTVPFLTWRSVPMQQAVATSSACGLPIAVVSALSFMILGWHDPLLPAHSLGFVYLPALLGIALTSMVFARFGARLAHRLSPRLLKRLFAALLFCVGLSFLF